MYIRKNDGKKYIHLRGFFMYEIILITIGFIFLIKGADLLINGAEAIARKLKVSDFIIGLLLVAVGTSFPEMIVSIEAASKGHDSLLIGNILGSCIYNLLLILGIMLLLKPIKLEHKPSGNLLILLMSMLLVGIIGNINNQISRKEGILLLLVFVIFLLSIFSNYKDSNVKEIKYGIVKSIFLVILGIILLKYGGNFVVDNSIKLAGRFNISETVIGTTIIAIGTSLPELVTSIIAIKKESTSIAIGSIIGSNIFNLLLVLGITSVIYPIRFSQEYNIYLILLIITTLIIYLYYMLSNKKEAGYKEGLLLIATFIIYNINLIK